jgi:quercetin 2,3-dioxygenase
MIRQSKGKIFLADERGLTETNWFRSWNTFNFGKYHKEHKQPFGDIYVLNDDTLDANRSLNMLIADCSHVLLLPVIGAISYNDQAGNKNLIAAGQAQLLTVAEASTIQISNPFDEGLINFLQVWVKADATIIAREAQLFTYSINKYPNKLTDISRGSECASAFPFTISIGKFEGRGETIHHLENKNSGFFAFVIEGAFEIEGRLLHARDGLALWDIDEAEIEALSNDAILLTIESPLVSGFGQIEHG